MTIEQSDVIDFVGIDRHTGNVVLTISDHLSWEDVETHTVALRKKIDAYLAFVGGGQFVESYPKARGRNVEIRIICEHEPISTAAPIIESFRCELESLGINFSCMQLPKGY
jgi:hypothetical protein